MQIETWPVERLKVYDKNARRIPQSAIDAVAKSIEAYGWQQPCVVDEAGVIVIGHVRRLAALQLGLTEVPVHVARGLSPEKIRALRLMDNRSHDEAQWDPEILTAEMLELRELDLDLSLTGFNTRELDGLLLTADERADDCPPVPEVAISRTGDLWCCGPHRVLAGDATSPADVERVLGGAKPFLMVTDPPYGVSLDAEWRDRALKNSAGPAEPSYMRFKSANRHHQSAGHSETTCSGDTIAEWSHAFELVPSLQIAYVWHASAFTSEVVQGLVRIGFLYPQQIIWVKPSPVMTRTHYWFQHEPCWYVRKKKAPWYGKGGAENSTIWSARSPKFIMGGSKEAGDEKQNHPTQKPAELIRKAIVNHLQQGNTVYDPFLGSGTCVIAAENTERVCYGLEIEPRYIDVICRRYMEFTGKPAILDNDGRDFHQVAAARAAVQQEQTADV